MERWMWLFASIIGGWIVAGLTSCVSDLPDSYGRRPERTETARPADGPDASDIRDAARQIFEAGR